MTKTRIYLSAMAAMFFVVGLSANLTASPLNDVPELRLIHDGDGNSGNASQTHKAGYPEDDKLRVYWFWSAVSDCARDSEPLMVNFAEAHPDVELIIVHSNADESIADAQRELRDRKFPLPVYRDHDAKLAIALNARITPEAFVMTATDIIYQGRTDFMQRGKAPKNFVDDAVKQFKAQKPVKPQKRRPAGCPITRP